jgi:hypothetical protein
MKGFSLKIAEQVIEFFTQCRIERAMSLAENPLPESGYFPSLFSVVASVKEIHERILIKVCGDVELDDNAQPTLDCALSTRGEIFIIMGMNVWNTAKDSDIWRVRVEKQITNHLAEAEDCHIFSYISQEGNTTKISFSWKVK